MVKAGLGKGKFKKKYNGPYKVVAVGLNQVQVEVSDSNLFNVNLRRIVPFKDKMPLVGEDVPVVVTPVPDDNHLETLVHVLDQQASLVHSLPWSIK